MDRQAKIGKWASVFLGLACLVGGLVSSPAIAGEDDWYTGSTLFGEYKYAKGFDHYEHVNPDAPQGGTLNSSAFGSFDSFNPFVVRGTPAAGLTYFGGILYDTLFEQSVDQPAAAHALVAEAFRRADDYSWAEYRLNPAAKFHDGKQITAEDVIWSLEVLKENHPLYNSYYKNITKASDLGNGVVRFEFDQKGNRELPHIVGDLPVLPKHWWTGKDASGKQRNIANPISEPPLGSGPYMIDKFDLGKSVTWKKAENYWAAKHPTRVGRYNYGAIHFNYFLDDNAIWEGFKKGGLSDTRQENSAKRWVTEYVFPAVEKKDVIQETLKDGGTQTYQAYFINTRRKRFSDPKVREALNYLFDFESMNKNLFYGQYSRTESPFQGGELQSTGLPEGGELAMLEPFRDQLDPRVFTEAFKLPVLGDAKAIRTAQRQALKLFKEAGYSFKDGKMTGPDGKQFQLEILGLGQTAEKIGIPYIENLKKLGIDASLRIVDTSQYQNRVNDFDFDVITGSTQQSLSPGNEQREYWSSQAAEQKGSRNYSGISSPVVDALVDKIIAAKDRQELVDATHALDRVIKWGFYAVPHWYNPNIWLAHWKKIKLPPSQPEYIGYDSWASWIDPEMQK